MHRVRKFDPLVQTFRNDSEVRGALTGHSLDTYAAAANAFMRWLRRHGVTIESVNRQIVEQYVLHLRTTPARHKPGLRRGNTVHRSFQSIRHYLRWVVDQGRLQGDPTDGISVKQPPDRIVDPLTSSEFSTLLNGCHRGATPLFAARNRALIWLCADLGLRIKTEALALDRRDVENETGLADEFVIGAKGRFRIVPLNDAPRRALSAYLRLRDDDCEALFIRWDQVERTWHRMTWVASRRMLSKCAIRLGLDRYRVHWHNLRRTAAVMALTSGESQYAVKAIFGWTKDQTASH